MTYTFTTDGDHEISWVYYKDVFDFAGDDCIWVDQFSWAPLAPSATQTTVVPVPYAWLEKYYPGTAGYEARAKSMAANGRNTVEEAYVAGLDPTDPVAEFAAFIEMLDGAAKVTWSPDLNTNGAVRVYTIY